MNKADIFRKIRAKGHRRNLITGAILRIGFIIIAWLIIAIPRKPAWIVSDHLASHVIFFLALGWAILALAAYYFRRFVVITTFFSTILVDTLGITALVAVTGGASSPFTILYLVEIVGVFFLGNFWQGIVVSLAGLLFFLVLNVLMLFKVIATTSPFVPDVPPTENHALWGATLVLLLIFIGYTIIMNAFMSRRVDRLRGQLADYKSNLASSSHELMAGFHDLESVSDRLKEQQILSEDAKRKMMKADHFASIGWLAAGLLNEFNNPLTSIITDVETLLMRKNENIPQRARNTCQKVLDSAERIQTVVKNLTHTIRPDGENYFNVVNINRLIERLAGLYKFEAMKRATEITLNLSPDSTSILAVESQVEQMLIHLINNGLEAINGKKGRIVISTKIEGSDLVLKIQDNGEGIEKNNMNDIFEPFYSSRPEKVGGGMGLYMVREVIENHGGKIAVKSERHEGTTVKVRLPLKQDQ